MSIFQPTVFPDQVTITYNPNGKLQAIGTSSKFSNISNTVSNGQSWTWGSYLLLSSKTSGVSAGLEWNGSAQAGCTADAIVLNSDSVSIDGFVSGNTTDSGSISVTITTTQANELIVVNATAFNGAITGVSDTAGLTWTARNAGSEYAAVATSALTDDVITATISTSLANSSAMMAFGITNVNTSAPFDTGAGIPSTSRTNGQYVISLDSAPVSTTGSNRVVIVLWTGDNSSTGFTVENVVLSVSSSDDSLTISPTTGTVVANLNPAHANTWTATQNFSAAPTNALWQGFYSNSTESAFFWNDTSGVNFNIGLINSTGAFGIWQAHTTSVFTVEYSGNVTAAGDVNVASGKTYQINGTSIFATANTWTALQTFGTEISFMGEQASGTTISQGSFIYDNGTNFVRLPLTAGTGITVTNTATSVTIASTATSNVTEKANASDTELTATSATTIATFTPAAQGNFMVMAYYRVKTAATTLTLTASWTDGTGAQSYSWVAGTSQAIGSYNLLPLYINGTASAIAVSATAGTANQVYCSATIIEIT